MDQIVRLNALSEQMRLEADADVRQDGTLLGSGAPFPGRCQEVAVTPASMPNGRTIKLLKSQLSSACERDCRYCAFRAGRDFRRESFRPEEFARLVDQLYRRGIIEGAFISSALAGGGVATQDRLLATAEILRGRLAYRGYLHLKIMPGAEKAQVERAMQLADRVSVNLEAPNKPRLAALAPGKLFDEELVAPLRWVNEIRRTRPAHLGWNGRWPSSTTQFVAGGADESDSELLHTSMLLYSRLALRRVYFMAFSPVEGTPLEEHAPTPAVRQLRLYQASFLLRDYGYDVEELPFSEQGDLPLNLDPKLAWARRELSESPVEVNRAGREQLLRVPGIGLKGAEALLRMRRERTIRELSDLRRLGIRAEQAARFVLLDGHRPAHQLSLF